MTHNRTYLFGIFIVLIVVVTACNSSQPSGAVVQSITPSDNQAQSNNAGTPGYQANAQNRTGAYRGNLSMADREKLFQQRQQAMIDACNAKNIGDSCIIQNARNNATGTCNAINQTVQCIVNRNYNGTRLYTP